ncbi:MAG TPA: tetratricopeptide repeat protein [Allocoleopsis sp.]
MLKDAQGLDITTAAAEAIAAIDQFIDQSLSYGKQAESAILQAVSADPTCAIAHAFAAAYYLSQESAVAWEQAIPYLRAAIRHQAKASQRERWWVKAIVAWARGDIDQAIAVHETITEQYPQDLLSVQQGQYHYFYQGDQAGLLQIAEKVLPANYEQPHLHYLYGMIAFGLEQCHRLSEAEAMGRKAIAINRDDPWAHHAVAHVMETQGRVEEGIAWMEGLADTWEGCNSMLYTHNWWHIALYYLEHQDFSTVLHLYDTKVWGRARPDAPKDQVGAIALLLRLELRGVEVGATRWREIAAHLSPRIHEHALPFQDLHYVYALALTEQQEQVQEMLESMEAHAHRIQPTLQQPWIEIALPAAKGMVAHAQGDWQQAIALLQPVLSRLGAIGGSHAQRELFEQVYADAFRQAEQREVHYLTGKQHASDLVRNSHQKLTSIYNHQTLAAKAS